MQLTLQVNAVHSSSPLSAIRVTNIVVCGELGRNAKVALDAQAR